MNNDDMIQQDSLPESAEAVHPEEVEQAAAEAAPQEEATAAQDEEIKALRGELMELKLRLALLTAGAAPERLEEGMKLAAGIMVSDQIPPESSAEEVLREYPHIKLAKRTIPRFSAESRGCGDGFAAIRGIFAKR